MSTKYRIPFVKNYSGRGYSMMEYTKADDGEVRFSNGAWHWPDEWRDNVPFKASVKLTGHGRGRSSVRVHVENKANGDRYSMAIAAFYDAVVHFGVTKGVIRGKWMFRKQGSNYTLWPVTPEEPCS